MQSPLQRIVPTRTRTHSMKYVFIILLIACVIAAFITSAVTHFISGNDYVYTVTNLQVAIAKMPEGWDGRTVSIRGSVMTYRSLCPLGSRACSTGHTLHLLTADQKGLMVPSFLLVAGPSNQVFMFLRRLPLLGGWVPEPQRLQGAIPITYHVQVRSMHGNGCAIMGPTQTVRVGCYEVLLIDAAPEDFTN